MSCKLNICKTIFFLLIPSAFHNSTDNLLNQGVNLEEMSGNVLRLAVWCGILALNIANINKILVKDYFSKEARTPH